MSRLRPLADLLLAVALTILALALMESTRSVEGSGPVSGVSVDQPPRNVEPGDAWNARIEVFGARAPALAPVLTVENTRTGTVITTPAMPTDLPGRYRARVVFQERGNHVASVLSGDGLADERPPPGSPAELVLLTLLATLPIAVRRRFPLQVLGVTLAAALTAHVAYDGFSLPGPVVAAYSVGAYVARPASLYGAAATAAALPLLLLGDSVLGFWELAAVYAIFAAVWLLGDSRRSRRERKQANVQRTAAEEQARMAREVHDIIGHSVSVMTIQAAAAGDAFDSRPTQVREALRAIESTGRETLAELRRLLAGDSGSFAPAPGLKGLDALAERVRSAGLAVELSAEPVSLPPSVDLTAYRIVQEALTNTLKHAQATSARVDVRRTGRTLEIDVVDDGQGAATVTPGHGIIGMRERAAVFGGDLIAEPAPGGGFAVRARIPLEEEP
jgi:signal transduction histidine kinase